jgi:hypothetical protein
MPFIIPNALDTTGGQRYAALDQAEPDSLDFEILGNNTSGVLSGCEVTAQISGGDTVNVSSGYVVLNSVAYPVAAVTNQGLANAPVGNQFNLVVARKKADNTIEIRVIPGTDSTTNPTYPRSISRIDGATVGTSTTIDPNTDVVLAAVYRTGSSPVTKANVVDKRVSVKSNVSFQGSTVPDNNVGSNGDLYYRTANQVSSGVYVKTNGIWIELAKYPIDPGVPIGTPIMWPHPTVNPNAAVWVEANGTAVNRAGTYADLYGVIGTTWGVGNGTTTYNLPDWRGFYLAGLPASGATMGTAAGAPNNLITLSVNQLPSHAHPITALPTDPANPHVHAITHTHTGSTGQDGDLHTHPFSGTTSTTQSRTMQNLITTSGSVPGYATSNSVSAVDSPNNNIAHDHPFSGSTNNASGKHQHTVSLPFTGDSQPAGQHSHVSNGNTDPVGSSATINVAPATHYVRYFLRYA